MKCLFYEILTSSHFSNQKKQNPESPQFPNPPISSSAHAAEEKLSLPSESFELIEASHHSASHSGSRGSRSGSHNGTPRHDEMKAWVIFRKFGGVV